MPTITLRTDHGQVSIEVPEDAEPAFHVEVDDLPVVGLLNHGTEHLQIGHWPDSEEFAPLAETAYPAAPL